MTTVTLETLNELLNSDLLPKELKDKLASFLNEHKGEEEIAELVAVEYPEVVTFIEDSKEEIILSNGRFQDAMTLYAEQTDLETGEVTNLASTSNLNSNFSPLNVFRFEGNNDSDDLGNSSPRLQSITVSGSREVTQTILNDTPRTTGDTQDDFFFTRPEEVRHINGSGNNLGSHTMGKAHTAFMTTSGYGYDDGIASAYEIDRPNVRDVSNEIFAQSGDIYNSQGLANLFWVWGQFLDHDINLTAEGHDEALAIIIPAGDPHFDPYGTGTQTMRFTRSGFIDGTGDSVDNPRLQENEITSYIDSSNIYGSDDEKLASLRDEGGYMKLDANGLLPVVTGMMGPEFAAGDVRANENVALTSMHTLFAREHNYWVDQIKAEHPRMSAEDLFQTAKMIVEAEIQHITFNEFLSNLVGEGTIAAYTGYNSNVDAQIATEFATAAFRFGHTMLSSDILRLQENGDESDFGSLTLREAFFRPDKIMTEGGIDEILRGVSGSYAQAIDNHVIDDVRNFLFGPPGAGGFDLVSLNIQRGRDHGLPDFNSVRESYGLNPLTDFSELTNDPALIAKLEALYGTIDHLDLWVGGLIENPVDGALVGETFQTIIADQFTRLRDGDRFWYEGRLSDDMLDMIQDTSLSDIILRNTDTEYLQTDALVAAIRQGGTSGNDIIIGTDARDLLIGFAGDDKLFGGLGEDTLYGGSGNDIFAFALDSAFGGIDTVRDFGAGDRIDVSDLLSGYDADNDNLADFVSTETQGDDLLVLVDVDGQGAGEAQIIAVLENTSDLDVNAIITQTAIA